jgi:hypothetical protein
MGIKGRCLKVNKRILKGKIMDVNKLSKKLFTCRISAINAFAFDNILFIKFIKYSIIKNKAFYAMVVLRFHFFEKKSRLKPPRG